MLHRLKYDMIRASIATVARTHVSNYEQRSSDWKTMDECIECHHIKWSNMICIDDRKKNLELFTAIDAKSVK